MTSAVAGTLCCSKSPYLKAAEACSGAEKVTVRGRRSLQLGP
jgi:hypothetical protein